MVKIFVAHTRAANQLASKSGNNWQFRCKVHLSVGDVSIKPLCRDVWNILGLTRCGTMTCMIIHILKESKRKLQRTVSVTLIKASHNLHEMYFFNSSILGRFNSLGSPIDQGLDLKLRGNSLKNPCRSPPGIYLGGNSHSSISLFMVDRNL